MTTLRFVTRTEEIVGLETIVLVGTKAALLGSCAVSVVPEAVGTSLWKSVIDDACPGVSGEFVCFPSCQFSKFSS